jgi:hypothetical protein
MIALLPAHRRAERFAALVDSASTTDASARDAHFLEIVGTLRTAATEAPAPRADYVADLRSRLMAEADTALVPTDRKLVLPHHAPRRQNRLTAAVAALVIVGGTAGVSVAAQSSLPGEALYPIKRGIEQVNETLSFSDGARGQDLLHQADARLSEIDSMLDAHASDDAVAANLQSFSNAAGTGGDLLFTTYQDNGNDDSVTTVRDFAGTGMGELTALADRAPASLRAEFAQAAQLLADLDQQARVLCADCGARDPLTMPSDLALASSKGLGQLLDKGGEKTGQAGAGTQTGTATPTDQPSAGATTGAPQITLPDLSGLLGGDPSGGTGTGTGGSTGSGVDSPLGGLLDPLPSSLPTKLPSKLPTKLPSKLPTTLPSGLDLPKVGKHLKSGLDQVTDPLLKPKKPLLP